MHQQHGWANKRCDRLQHLAHPPGQGRWRILHEERHIRAQAQGQSELLSPGHPQAGEA